LHLIEVEEEEVLEVVDVFRLARELHARCLLPALILLGVCGGKRTLTPALMVALLSGNLKDLIPVLIFLGGWYLRMRRRYRLSDRRVDVEDEDLARR